MKDDKFFILPFFLKSSCYEMISLNKNDESSNKTSLLFTDSK